jgi:hypothetical protein
MVFESKEASDEERSKTEKALYEKIGKLDNWSFCGDVRYIMETIF